MAAKKYIVQNSATRAKLFNLYYLKGLFKTKLYRMKEKVSNG